MAKRLADKALWIAMACTEGTDCPKDYIGAKIEQYKGENVIDETAHGKRFQYLTSRHAKPFLLLRLRTV